MITGFAPSRGLRRLGLRARPNSSLRFPAQGRPFDARRPRRSAALDERAVSAARANHFPAMGIAPMSLEPSSGLPGGQHGCALL